MKSSRHEGPGIALALGFVAFVAACGSSGSGEKGGSGAAAAPSNTGAAGSAGAVPEENGGATTGATGGAPTGGSTGGTATGGAATGGSSVGTEVPYESSCEAQQCTADEQCADGPDGTYCVHPCPGQPCPAGQTSFCDRQGGIICVPG